MAYFNENGNRVYELDDLIRFAQIGSFGQQYGGAIYHALIHLKNLQAENALLKQELIAQDQDFESIQLPTDND